MRAWARELRASDNVFVSDSPLGFIDQGRSADVEKALDISRPISNRPRRIRRSQHSVDGSP
jgi:hypothetical protein